MSYSSLTPILLRSMSLSDSTDLNSPISFEMAKILFVMPSGAGPPLAQLYLMPKSASIPPLKNRQFYDYIKIHKPGLCEAVNKIPPSACCLRTIAESAGVDRIPSLDNVSNEKSRQKLTLSNNDFADSVSGRNLDNFFNCLGQKITPITTDHNSWTGYFFSSNSWEDTLILISEFSDWFIVPGWSSQYSTYYRQNVALVYAGQRCPVSDPGMARYIQTLARVCPFLFIWRIN